METIQQVRERRAARAKDARNILDENTGEKWTKKHEEQVDAIYAEIEALDHQIERHEKQMNIEAGVRFAKLTGIKDSDLDPLSPKAVFRKWVRNGTERMDHDEIKVLNTLSTTTGAQGGFTVETEVAKTIADALKGYRGVRQVAEVFQTAMGNDINFPTTDGTAEVGELIAQNVTASPLDPVFGSVTLTPYKYSSKIIAIPFELLQDTNIDMEAFLVKRITDRLGRITNQHLTTGSGAGQPNGVVTAALAGKVGLVGETLTLIYDDLVDLQESIDYAYQDGKNCRWMMAQSTRKIVRKIKDTSGRPIWMPGWGDIGGRQPEELLGDPIQINNDMAAPGVSAKSIVYGDFSYYKVRDVMDMTLFRFTDSAYAKLGQVGFLAWLRSGGNLVDVGGAIKYFQHSAS